MVRITGTGRNQTTHDNVLFQAAQFVAFTRNGSFGQDTCSLLERCGRDERLGCQRRFGDTQQIAGEGSPHFAIRFQLAVSDLDARVFNLFAFQEVGTTGAFDGGFTQHLTNDNFDVFIVNLNALQTVYILDFVNDVTRHSMNATQTQNVVRRFRTIGNHITTFYTFTFEHVELTPFRNHLFVRVTTINRRNHQTTFAFGFFTEGNDTCDFSKDCRLFRTTRFEQVRNARQTTGDILGTAGFLRNTRQGVTRTDLYAIFQLYNRFTRQEVLRRHIGTRDQNVITLSINDFQRRTQIFTTGSTFSRIQNHQRRQTGQFVGLTRNGLTVDHVSEADETTHFSDNRHGVRVPVCHGFAAGNLLAITFRHDSAIRHFIALFGTTEFVDQLQFGVTRSDNQFTAGVHNRLHVAELDATFIFHLDAGFSSRTRCRTTDVERTHRQLCTRFTDGLCRDNADSFTFVDDVATRQVTTIAVRTYTKVGVAGYNGTHFNGVNGVCFQQVTPLFVQQRVAWNQNVRGTRFQHIFCCHTAQNAVTQRLFHVATLDNRGHQDTFVRTTVIFGHYQILRDVNQTTSQVTGVRGFQCGIRQTFTRTVRGDEVLEYVQTFTEVRGDWRFDDGAIRLRHQTTHTGQLTNLCRRTTRTGVGHHVDAVEGDLLLFLAVTVNHGFGLQVIHHRFGYTIVRRSPDIDNFVIAFASGYQTRLELLLDLSNFGFRFRDDLVFFLRDDHVINTNGRT